MANYILLNSSHRDKKPSWGVFSCDIEGLPEFPSGATLYVHEGQFTTIPTILEFEYTTPTMGPDYISRVTVVQTGNFSQDPGTTIQFTNGSLILRGREHTEDGDYFGDYVDPNPANYKISYSSTDTWTFTQSLKVLSSINSQLVNFYLTSVVIPTERVENTADILEYGLSLGSPIKVFFKDDFNISEIASRTDKIYFPKSRMWFLSGNYYKILNVDSVANSCEVGALDGSDPRSGYGTSPVLFLTTYTDYFNTGTLSARTQDVVYTFREVIDPLVYIDIKTANAYDNFAKTLNNKTKNIKFVCELDKTLDVHYKSHHPLSGSSYRPTTVAVYKPKSRQIIRMVERNELEFVLFNDDGAPLEFFSDHGDSKNKQKISATFELTPYVENGLSRDSFIAGINA